MADYLQENDIVFLMAIGVTIMLALALAFVLFFNRSQRKLLQEKNNSQALQLAHQQELVNSIIFTQENERKRIAKDLHDDIGSKLNVALLHMHRLQKLRETPEKFGQTVGEINQMLHTIVDTTRRISHELLPPTLENFGLEQAITELCEAYQQTGMLEIQFTANTQNQRIASTMTELHLFRVLQELIKNSVKHGEAQRIKIQLDLLPEHISLRYSDDGKGFDQGKIKKKGMGMNNLDTRINMIGGQFQLQTAPNQGVQVTIQAPITIDKD